MMSTRVRRGRGRPRAFEDEDVFQVTAHVLLEGGSGNLTLQQIARRLGCTHQALGQRFSTREGLLQAFLDWLTGHLRDDIDRLQRETPSPLAAARAIWTMPIDSRITGNSEAGHRAVWVLLILELRREPQLHGRISETLDRIDQALLGLVRDAQERGELRPADPADILEGVVVAVTGAVIKWTINPREDLLTKIERCRERALTPYLAS